MSDVWPPKPLDVVCPYCKADVGRPCRDRSGRLIQPSHVGRDRASAALVG